LYGGGKQEIRRFSGASGFIKMNDLKFTI
jgi:hypothetical protein